MNVPISIILKAGMREQQQGCSSTGKCNHLPYDEAFCFAIQAGMSAYGVKWQHVLEQNVARMCMPCNSSTQDCLASCPSPNLNHPL